MAFFGGFLVGTVGAVATLHVMAALWFFSGLLTFLLSPDLRTLN
jgi:hypothetical protein